MLANQGTDLIQLTSYPLIKTEDIPDLCRSLERGGKWIVALRLLSGLWLEDEALIVGFIGTGKLADVGLKGTLWVGGTVGSRYATQPTCKASPSTISDS